MGRKLNRHGMSNYFLWVFWTGGQCLKDAGVEVALGSGLASHAILIWATFVPISAHFEAFCLHTEICEVCCGHLKAWIAYVPFGVKPCCVHTALSEGAVSILPITASKQPCG
jgi:hypothetical protein